MSVIAYTEYEESPVAYFEDESKKATRCTIRKIDTNEIVIIFDFYPTEEVMYWLSIEVSPQYRDTDEWLQYLHPLSYADPALIVANHLRPKAALVNCSPDVVTRLEGLFNIRSQILQDMGKVLPDKLFVSGATMGVYDSNNEQLA